MTVSAEQSLWLVSDSGIIRPSWSGEFDIDIAGIGGGITGLTTALLVKRDGARLAAIEARRVGSGVSACMTPKVSALLASSPLSDGAPHHGAAGAARDAQARLAAVELGAELADEEAIDCSLERQAACPCAASQTERSM